MPKWLHNVSSLLVALAGGAMTVDPVVFGDKAGVIVLALGVVKTLANTFASQPTKP